MQNKETLRAILVLNLFKCTISLCRSLLMLHLHIVSHLGVEQLHILSFLYFARSYF